jgi:predicted dehydrogenase
MAVIATGPEHRAGLLDSFPKLRAIIVEKPLGTTLEDAQGFLDDCRRRNILVQVNLWRRADSLFRRLAGGRLEELVGTPQAATCYYGNGLVNNGTHMIDFARMLFGEVAGFQMIGARPGFAAGPIAGDRNPRFILEMASGLGIDFQPLQFSAFREVGLIVWGTKGRIDILAEGLSIQHFPLADHRSMQGEHEIAVDAPHGLESTVGTALYEMYENLADCLGGCLDGRSEAQLWSTGASALATTAIVDAVRLADEARQAAR